MTSTYESSVTMVDTPSAVYSKLVDLTALITYVLGIRGSDFNRTPELSEEYGTTQGVYVSEVTSGSGAEKAGIKAKDVIRKIDNIKVNKFSDLTGYINTKRPNDTVNVTVLRNGVEKEIAVKLTKLSVTQLPIGLEVTNASKDELKFYQTENGVKISKTLSDQYAEEEFVGAIITEINGDKIYDIRDAEEAFKSLERGQGLTMTFIDKTGQKQRVIFR